MPNSNKSDAVELSESRTENEEKQGSSEANLTDSPYMTAIKPDAHAYVNGRRYVIPGGADLERRFEPGDIVEEVGHPDVRGTVTSFGTLGVHVDFGGRGVVYQPDELRRVHSKAFADMVRAVDKAEERPQVNLAGGEPLEALTVADFEEGIAALQNAEPVTGLDPSHFWDRLSAERRHQKHLALLGATRAELGAACDELRTLKRLHHVDKWVEELGDVIFLRFASWDEPPTAHVTSPISSDFDEDLDVWFLAVDLNSMLEQALQASK